MRLPLVVTAFLALAACGPTKTPDPPSIVVTVPDAGSFTGDPLAVAACVNLSLAGCPEGWPSPKGVPCPVWMYQSRDFLDLPCMARETTKFGLMNKCNVRCKE